MKQLFYDIFIFFYSKAILLASLGNNKARKWVLGRQQLPLTGSQSPSIWMHCSSLGEFEQGRPVFEALRQQFPTHRFILSFFSPSGYEIRKNYLGADHICYLPIDTAANAKKILADWNPQLVIWVKYEYWFHFLHEINQQKIPLLLISANFRHNQPFFKPWGGFWRSMLHCFSHIFVQTESSLQLLQSILPEDRFSLSGDTRFDRVLTLTNNRSEVDGIAAFIGQKKCLVAGSTWPEDEQLIASCFAGSQDEKIIIAPHQIDNHSIQKTTNLFRGAILYSNLKAMSAQELEASPVLIIDNIGLLSSLYAYADVSYLGGGFNRSGIHNTLEAAAYGKPVVFGPNYFKFEEAKLLIEKGGGFSIRNLEELMVIMVKLFQNQDIRMNAGKNAAAVVRSNAGATKKILAYIEGNRLLTS